MHPFKDFTEFGDYSGDIIPKWPINIHKKVYFYAISPQTVLLCTPQFF